MKLWILSDLHLSRKAASGGVIAPNAIPDADVTIIAGDVCEGVEDAITWLSATIARRMPVVYVVGNHEFYGEYIGQARRIARAQAARVPNLHLLDDADVVIDGVRFVGATLWTDYLLFAHGDQTSRRQAMRTIKERLSDHVQIWMDPAQPGFIARNFEPRDALALHETSLAWLDCKLAEPHPGRTVVVTHHAPHPRSIAQRWAGYIDVTPDAVPVISPVASRPGLVVATGFSGHGFGLGPGAGRLTADLVTGAAPLVDPSDFRLSRFFDGSKIVPLTGV